MSTPLDLPGFEATLVERGLRGMPVAEQVDGFCRGLAEAGFRARRFNMSIGTLHPRIGAHSYVWRPDEGLATELHLRRASGDNSQAYLQSPIHHLRRSGDATLRRKLDAGAPVEFPILGELRDGGMTDYAARMVSFDDSPGSNGSTGPFALSRGPNPMQGIFFSCATDAAEGFDDMQLRQVGDLLPYLALAVKSRSTLDVARTLLDTYLGEDAGGRVLTGAIDRHSVQAIQAVIWFCDLRGFSRTASRVSQTDLVELLDTYLELMARPVLDNRGQILKFMGDGFLATFDLALSSREGACADAVQAATQLVDRVPAFNESRRASGRETLDFGVAIHMGEVLYGNIGTKERLDFTVVGSAVNEASRIEGLCRPLGRHVLVSSSVHEAAANDSLVSLGVHALRGIREPQELFTIADRSGGR